MLTIILIAINIFLYLLQFGQFIDYTTFGLRPESVFAGEYFRLFTSAFLHGDVNHLFSNMLSLYNLGYYCEKVTGRSKYTAALVVSHITSALCVLFFSRSTAITIGYSGVVFGILGYFAASLYKSDRKLDSSERYLLIRMLLPNILISLLPGISWQGHFGGFIGGLLTGLLIL